MRRYCNKVLFIWPLTFICTVVLSWFATKIINKAILDNLTDSKSRYLNVYYNYHNAFRPEFNNVHEGFKDLVLIDVSVLTDGSGHERAAIARLLDTVVICNPASIGLDLLFPSSVEVSHEEDELLTQAVLRAKDKLVVAAGNYKLDGALVHSFFTQPTGVEYGTVNGQSFYGFEMSDQVNDSTTVEKFVVKLARKGGYLAPEEDLKDGIVDYKSRDCSRQIIRNLKSITKSRLEGKVVLIGEFTDSRDYVNLPFRIDGESRMAGSSILAYQLFSIMGPGRMIHRASQNTSFWVNLIAILILSFVFVVFSILENDWISMNPPRNIALTLLGLIVKMLVLFLAGWGWIAVCCGIITYHHVMIDALVFFIAEVLILDFVCKFWTMFYNYKYGEK